MILFFDNLCVPCIALGNHFIYSFNLRFKLLFFFAEVPLLLSKLLMEVIMLKLRLLQLQFLLLQLRSKFSYFFSLFRKNLRDTLKLILQPNLLFI